MHWRAGRAKKDSPRYRCGRLKPQPVDPTPELAAKRLAAIGDSIEPKACSYMDRARSAWQASSPLGILFARTLVDDCGHDAGRRYAGIYRRAARTATGFAVPRPDQMPGARPLGDTVVGADAWRSKFSAARRSLKQRGPRVMAVVERIVLYDQAIEERELPLLREGLAALDRHFRGR
jgi:hypothetical protein